MSDRLSQNPTDSKVATDVSRTPAFDDEPAWLATCLDEMIDSWNRGERPPLGSILARFPEIDDHSAVRLLYEDISIRRDAGLELPTEEVLGVFPRYRDQLAVLLGWDRLLKAPEELRFPEPGERLGDFELHSILGSGATGRTYLAEQPNLADRHVVLKVLPLEHEEHLSLARLQHSFIVPLYSEHDFPELGLRGLCMPFLGGNDLARILDALRPIAVEKRTWGHVIDALDRVRPRIDPHQGVVAPLRKNRDRISYEKGVCLIASFLAEALHYAHERGLIHLDVKPSNVLIAADGEPMLLDFHLAQPPIRAGDLAPQRLGGTRGYMSPEQVRAMDCIRADLPIDVDVDRTSDIYSLGLVLAEILAGRSVEADGTSRPARIDRLNRQISRNLADLVEKCLRPRPADRYQTAEALADDLKRHFRNEPMRGVRSRNPLESWRRFRQRRLNLLHNLLAPLLVTITLVLLSLGYLFYYWSRSEQSDQTTMVVNHTLQVTEQLRRNGMLKEASRNLAIARSLIGRADVRTGADWAGLIRLEQQRIDDADHARQLRELADYARQTVGLPEQNTENSRKFLREAGRIVDDWSSWSEAGLLGRTTENADRIKDDLFDVVVALLDRRSRQPGGKPSVSDWKSAMGNLHDLVGTTDALRLEASRMIPESDRPPWLGEPTPGKESASRLSQLGRAYLRMATEGDVEPYRSAYAAFQASLRLRPNDPFTQFHTGLCAYKLGYLDESLAAFSGAIALSESDARSFYHRALTFEALARLASLGESARKLKWEEAIADYDRVLQLEPGFYPALVNRAILLYLTGRYPDARVELEKLLERREPARQGLLRFYLASVQVRLGDLRSADVNASLAEQLGYPNARKLVDQLKSRR